MQENEPKKRVILSITGRTCVRLGITAFVLMLAITWWKPLVHLIQDFLGAAISLILGFVLAYVVNILMSLYERHYFRKHADKGWVKKSRRPVCLIAAIATVIGAVILLLSIVIPQLVNAISLILEKDPGLLKDLSENEALMNLLPESIREALQNTDYKSLVQGVLDFLTNGESTAISVSNVADLLRSLTSGFMTAFMAFIFSIYILLGKERLGSQFKRLCHNYLSRNWSERVTPFFSVANSCFHNFIVGQVTEAIIIGVLCALGMWVLRLPYAAMIGAVVGVTALIPILGCYLGAIIGALMCLSVSPLKAVAFLVFIFCLQQFEDNLIYPRVVGTSLGLPGIWVLAAVTVGGGIGGLAGMILSVPVAATIYQLIRLDLQRRESQEKQALTAADMVGKLKQEQET